MSDYKSTLNLPKTGFAMKANLPQREPETLKRWQKEGLYQQIRDARKGAPKFILHDGPPYANGDNSYRPFCEQNSERHHYQVEKP